MSQQYYPSHTFVLPLTTVRSERTLPWPGEILVSSGQQVEPSDVVARAGQPRPLLILDVTRKLELSGPAADQCILKVAGETIHHGEKLAEHKQPFGRTRKIVAPVEGTVLSIRAGRMIIQPKPDIFELRALLAGVVARVIPGRGVTIETPGALIQGVWGSGQEAYGVLKMGVNDPAATFRGEQIEIAHHGSVLVCGATLDANLLERAQEMQVRGLIVGGVPAVLREKIIRQPVPVIATEGAGRIPISSAIFSLLQANQGRETILLARATQRITDARPEIITPLPAMSPPETVPRPGTPLAPGLKVRIRRAPYWGVVGIINKVHLESRAADSGVRYPGADVTLDDGSVVFIPHTNLDLIGN